MSHDENALFYNPAGLAAVDTTLVNIPFQAEFSNELRLLSVKHLACRKIYLRNTYKLSWEKKYT
ncbi:MAG: hypothetical protein CM15mP45_14520 [Deltaproteobacteria bacterium]|nr:MAG: hypothetical protein CM15mP45_14520 [Deltaproteobacteria bacterium]